MLKFKLDFLQEFLFFLLAFPLADGNFFLHPTAVIWDYVGIIYLCNSFVLQG